MITPIYLFDDIIGFNVLLSFCAFVSNLECLYEVVPGGRQAEWFAIVSAMIEYDFAPAITVNGNCIIVEFRIYIFIKCSISFQYSYHAMMQYFFTTLAHRGSHFRG